MEPQAYAPAPVRQAALARTAASRAGVLGSIPVWVPLVIVLAGVGWVWRTSESEARSRAGAWVDLTRSALFRECPDVFPQWSDTLRQFLAEEGRVRADDRSALESLCSKIEQLPFVEKVGSARFIRPDGLDIPLRLHQPIACVRWSSKYYPVAMIPDDKDARGVLLPGAADVPHRMGSAEEAYFLPVLAGFDAGGIHAPQVGDELKNGSVLAALDIARSLVEHLGTADRVRMGRALIDATREVAFDGLPGGARLELEGVGSESHGRVIHFGDAPCEAGPGELPVEAKWGHVSEALERGFDAVDVRFDEAEYYR
ncbi:MAG TPA: hypothetical protein EYQ74_03925 [Planctomycetes bacterium]|nr:hypothetical protein [Planctomycetota bacterium]HIK61762.1 hypothetical protein [Planctomycetota bacterium]